MKLEGRKVLITGASGNLGEALVRQFQGEGARVAGMGWKRELPVACERFWRVDLQQTREAEPVFQAIAAEWGPVDILVHNAGQPLDALLLQTSADEWENLWRVHLLASGLLARALLPGMMQNRRGCILNISSMAANHPLKGQVAYASAKAGLEAMTRGLAREVGAKGIRVNAIAPGFVAGDWLNRRGEAEINKLLEEVPLRRLAQAEEVARLAVFLASDDAAYMTGQVVGIDGGAGM